MTLPSPRRPSSRAAAASTSFALVATIASPASASPAGSVDAWGRPTKSARPETRMPFSATAAACSSRRQSRVTSATRERWAAKRLPMTPPPTTQTFSLTAFRRRGSSSASKSRCSRPGPARIPPRLGPQRLDRARDPDAEPAAAEGNEPHVGFREVFEDLEPDRPVPRHHLLVLDRVDEDAFCLGEARFLDRLPPAFVRHLDHAPAESLDRRQLRLDRAFGHDDRGRNAELARRPSDALAHVPGARGHDARLQLGGVEL